MGFPFETATWDGVSGAIFMGLGSSAPATYSMIAIGLCFAALIIGYMKEAIKYRAHK